MVNSFDPGSYSVPFTVENNFGTLGHDVISNYQNVYSQILDEQRALNQLQMEREDSAYQRMVADMQKAGLNPWTGISSGGSSSSALAPAKKSAFDSLMQVFNYNEKALSNSGNQMIASIKTGAQIALGILGLLF